MRQEDKLGHYQQAVRTGVLRRLRGKDELFFLPGKGISGCGFELYLPVRGIRRTSETMLEPLHQGKHD